MSILAFVFGISQPVKMTPAREVHPATSLVDSKITAMRAASEELKRTSEESKVTVEEWSTRRDRRKTDNA